MARGAMHMYGGWMFDAILRQMALQSSRAERLPGVRGLGVQPERT